MINSTLFEYNPDDYDNWVDIPYGYQEEGDWMDTIWGPGYITFKTDVFGGVVTLHCHILIHEDQGSMGTAFINDGCDGDYKDMGTPGSCHYVDTCEQFGPLVPTPDPTERTEVIEVTPAPISPTPQPTYAVSDEDETAAASIIVLQLWTTKSLSNFEEDADLYTNGDVNAFAKILIQWLLEDMVVDGNAAPVNISITLVEKGSVKISYSLTSTSVEQLVTAVTTIETRVTNKDKFQYTEDGTKYKLKEHKVVVSYTLVSEYFDATDGWDTKEIVLLIVVVVIFGLCCGMIVCCFHTYKKRKKRDENLKNLEATNLHAMQHQEGAGDVEDPIDNDGGDDVMGDTNDVIAAMEMIEIQETKNDKENNVIITGNRSRSKSLKSRSRSHGGGTYLSPEKSKPNTLENSDSDDDEEEEVYKGSEDEVEQQQDNQLVYMQSLPKCEEASPYL